MTEQLVNIGFGKETFTNSSVSLSAFIVENGFERTLPSKKFKRVGGGLQRFPASQYPEVNGYLYLDAVSVPEGTVILLQASHRYGGSPLRDGGIFIRTRSTGPMLAVYAHLPKSIESTITGDFIVFQGRGDVLTLKELALYGVVPHKGYINGFLEEEEVAECYRIAELASATADKPVFEKVKDRDGAEVLTPQRKKRKLSLRRP